MERLRRNGRAQAFYLKVVVFFVACLFFCSSCAILVLGFTHVRTFLEVFERKKIGKCSVLIIILSIKKNHIYGVLLCDTLFF